MPRRKLDEPIYRLRLRGERWYIDWTDGGRTKSVSTGQADRAAAERWRDQWIAGRAQPLPPPQPVLAAILDAYVTARLPHVESKETLQLNARTLKRLIGNLEPHMLARDTYTKARSSQVGPGSLRREVTVLRAALSWALRERWIDEVPYVEMPPRPAPRERWLTRDEVERLITSARSHHIRLFITLAYRTAARTGAILELTWDRVDLDRARVDYRRPGRAETKKRRATVPLNLPTLQALQEARMIAMSDYVIEYNGRRVLSIKTGFRRACLEAGIAECSPHVLRHTAASHMVMAGVPVSEVARMLGDSEPMVEKVYGKHSPDYLQRAADALAGENESVSGKRRLSIVKDQQNR